MAKITLKGTPVNTSGNLPAKGSKAPDFKLVKSDLSNLTLSELKGKKVILKYIPKSGNRYLFSFSPQDSISWLQEKRM